ncbi:hypothetical protein DL764_000278 [Monosporascus ibericus]|uniref:MADS-box domain-containing protein n=1 Tax=Monosporascus ibericus TaxID=155417 RepID=A0A4Q4TZC5_9PEZI|nr:hypothetical protein DL764_000278 [Monosporascus ibericus]
MAARARSPAQKRKRAFSTRTQGMIRKVKEMHQFTDAKAAVVGIHNGKMFWYDEAGVLTQLGIAHEPRDGLRARSPSGSSSFSSAESASPFGPGRNSPRFVRDGSSVPSEPESDTSISSVDAATSFLFEDESSSTTGTWTSSPADKTRGCADIDLLDLDYFGLEKDNDYLM